MSSSSSDYDPWYWGSPSRIDATISAVFGDYSSQLNYQVPKSIDNPWVFWSPDDEGCQNYSSSDDPEFPNLQKIHERIKLALSRLYLSTFFPIVQFWAPIKIAGRRLLTTSDQPFGLKDVDDNLARYRLSCVRYKYDIDVNKPQVEDEEDPMIITGAPARAFLNRMPEIVPDISIDQGCPLVPLALQSGLKASFVLPVFSNSSQSCCVGVFECLMLLNDAILYNLNELNRPLRAQGLFPYNVQAHLPYEEICGLNDARNEIDKALQIIRSSHGLNLANAWIAYENKNHMVLSSSLEDTQKKQMFGLLLTSQCFEYENRHFDDSYRSYFDLCHVHPLKMGEGLPGRTLESYEAHFCEYITRERKGESDQFFNKRPPSIGFTICLKSVKTGDLHYAFEFLLPHDRDYDILLESLILTLKRCLPSFKYASGEELGDELSVLDFGNDEYFMVFEGNKLLEEETGEECLATLEPKRKRMETRSMSKAKKKLQ